jgi:hypothetical protein
MLSRTEVAVWGMIVVVACIIAIDILKPLG